MPSPHTLAETEEQVAGKVGALPLDVEAMAVISNLFRAANATRNYLERSVLAASGLSWTAFVVLWVTWIWEPIETRQIAEEGGFSDPETFEVIQRPWHVKGMSVRPVQWMFSHSAFLVVTRKTAEPGRR